MNSILSSIKKMHNIDDGVTHFDTEMIIHINTALMRLTQLGVGSSTGFSITDKSKTWTDLIGTRLDVEAIKTYVYLKVRLMFDPPTNSTLLEAYKSNIQELEWTINAQVDEAYQWEEPVNV